MTYKYMLDTSSKKFYCPNCNKKEFVRILDADGNYLNKQYGRCDRQVKCRYDKRPSDTSFMKAIPQIENKKPISYFPEDLQLKTMKGYKSNSFHQILSLIYDEQTIDYVFNKYIVGTVNKFGKSPIFWQKDMDGRIRTGKIIAYNIETTKRIKEPWSKITWAHSVVKIDPYNLKQVLFGCHLISENPSSIFCLVEAEKTAIVGACELPQFIWLSTGGEQNFNKEMLTPLKGKRVVVFPDIDKHEKWTERAINYSKELNIDMVVSNYVLDQTINLDRAVYSDLADLVLLRNSKFQKAEVQIAIEGMIRKNPCIQTLIDKLDLDVKNATITQNNPN